MHYLFTVGLADRYIDRERKINLLNYERVFLNNIFALNLENVFRKKSEIEFHLHTNSLDFAQLSNGFCLN